jgi:hypothetical protein
MKTINIKAMAVLHVITPLFFSLLGLYGVVSFPLYLLSGDACMVQFSTIMIIVSGVYKGVFCEYEECD